MALMISPDCDYEVRDYDGWASSELALGTADLQD